MPRGGAEALELIRENTEGARDAIKAVDLLTRRPRSSGGPLKSRRRRNPSAAPIKVTNLRR